MKIKLETQIAKDNIKNLNKKLPDLTQANISGMVISHKLSCKRFLNFLRNKKIKELVFDADIECWHKDNEFIEDKILDLKQAIKLYEEVGIK